MTVTAVSTRRSAASTNDGLVNRGDRGAAVTAVQQKLAALGFMPRDGVDGIFGPNTENAVRAFQRSRGLSVDGVVGPRTMAALNATAAPSAPSTGGTAPAANLRRGSSGGAVRQLQNALNGLGYDCGNADGQFGSRTEGALKKFQAEWGLSVDGQYGPNSRGALNRALGGQRPPHPGASPSTGNVGNVGNGSGVGGSVVDIVRGQLGVREATGNNDGIPSTRYMSGRKEPWCANFVSWAFRQAGKPLPGNQRSLASVQYMEDQMKGAGKWFPRGAQTPRPGDIIFFANRGSSDAGPGRHVGIVEKVENGRVYTIEGNTSNMVARRSYPLDLARISGYGRM